MNTRKISIVILTPVILLFFFVLFMTLESNSTLAEYDFSIHDVYGNLNSKGELGGGGEFSPPTGKKSLLNTAKKINCVSEKRPYPGKITPIPAFIETMKYKLVDYTSIVTEHLVYSERSSLLIQFDVEKQDPAYIYKYGLLWTVPQENFKQWLIQNEAQCNTGKYFKEKYKEAEPASFSINEPL